MASPSKIEWTGHTWNPTTGCSKISPGCKHCYAAREAKRLQSMNNLRYRYGFDFTLHPDKLNEPLHLGRPSLIFVNSMSDVFYEDMPFEYLSEIFRTMNTANRHIYQILTKRGDRLAQLGRFLPWADHIWMGVSVESEDIFNQRGERPTDRIDQLRCSGARVKFLSAEPLIGPLGKIDLTEIDWVIVGGESGPEARLMELDWARDLVRQCQEADVPVFVKQLGAVWAKENRADHKKGGDMHEWPEDLRIRQMPRTYANWPGHCSPLTRTPGQRHRRVPPDNDGIHDEYRCATLRAR